MNQSYQTQSPTQPDLEQYNIATPYGLLTITNGGRTVTFELFSDIRQSEHNTAIFNYIQNLKKQGITKFNCDHIHVTGQDRHLPLTRGRAKLDLVYWQNGNIHELEFKTPRQLGVDRAAIQLRELATHCQNLILVVARNDINNAHQILGMINLERQIKVDTYEIYEQDDND